MSSSNPTSINGNSKRLIRLRKQAERDGAYRVAKRLQAVVLNSEGRTSGELAHLLGSPRSRVSEWLARYQTFGVEGLLEGHRSGRPLELTSSQRKQLDDILESGPRLYSNQSVDARTYREFPRTCQVRVANAMAKLPNSTTE